MIEFISGWFRVLVLLGMALVLIGATAFLLKLVNDVMDYFCEKCMAINNTVLYLLNKQKIDRWLKAERDRASKELV